MKLTKVEDALKVHQDLQLEWMMEATQLKWLKESSRCAPYIFSTFKQQSIQKDITKLIDADRNTCSY